MFAYFFIFKGNEETEGKKHRITTAVVKNNKYNIPYKRVELSGNRK